MEENSHSTQQSEQTIHNHQLQVTVLASGSTSEDAPDAQPRSRKRKYRSPIWDYFVSAKCIKCGLSYSHSENTSNLIKVGSS